MVGFLLPFDIVETMKLLHRWRWAFGAVALLITVFLSCWFSPWADYARGYWQLTRYTETCPPDQLRIEYFTETSIAHYFTEADYATITIDLFTGKSSADVHRSIPFDGFNSYNPLYSFQPQAFSSDKSRLTEIERILSNLAVPANSEKSSYRYQVHMAFWRDNHLCIFRYSRGDREKLRELASILGTGYWFHGPQAEDYSK
jgi:hypothetical protein